MPIGDSRKQRSCSPNAVVSSGLTLPVWVAAAARAALCTLLKQPFASHQPLVLPDREDPLPVPVISSAPLGDGSSALAISHCDPGPGLDLTRGLEIWVHAEWVSEQREAIELIAGEGVGRHGSSGALCISSFARHLVFDNLTPLLPEGRQLRLELVFPRGRDLAERTSNAAFGVVDGLALIGLQAEVQRSAAPDQLQSVLDQLARIAAEPDGAARLVLVIGENGLDLARQHQLTPVLKVGNWMGPVLVAAAEAGVRDLLLLGYHGKLIKLAGGIFHTHHHLADGRLEVLTALALDCGLPLDLLQQLRTAESVEAAFQGLAQHDPDAVQRLGSCLAATVERRAAEYVARYGRWPIQVAAALFDRNRDLRWKGPVAAQRFFTLKD